MLITKRRARAVNQAGYPQLVALSEGSNIALDKPIILIGRHQECDIQIPSRKISRRHCCIALISDHLVVRDLGSTNGIRINGIKVVEGNLQQDDELMIGNVCYQVKWGMPAAPMPGGKSKQGIKPGPPPVRHRGASEESFEEPMPLPDVAMSHPALKAEPKPAPPAKPATGSLEIPDSVALAPLDPPAKG